MNRELVAHFQAEGGVGAGPGLHSLAVSVLLDEVSQPVQGFFSCFQLLNQLGYFFFCD